jgi:hypothetical protein
MKLYAVVGPFPPILRYVEVADAERVLPVVELFDDVGANQVLGPIEVDIEEDRVLYRRRAVRALKGIVAVIDEGGVDVVEYRDLGDDLTAVADNVLPVEDERPTLAEGEAYGEPEVSIADGWVRRVYPVVSDAGGSSD